MFFIESFPFTNIGDPFDSPLFEKGFIFSSAPEQEEY